MITEAEIYWATRFDTILTASFILWTASLIGTILVVAFILINLAESDYNEDEACQRAVKCAKKIVFTLLSILSLSGLIQIFLPTTTQYFAIKIIPAIANNQKIQGISDKSLAVIEKYLQLKLSELDKQLPAPIQTDGKK